MLEAEIISEKKKLLRQKMSEIRDSIEMKSRKIQEEKVLSYLRESDFLTKHLNIYLYVSFKSEFSTERIINLLLEKEKKVMLPRIDICEGKKVMNFYPYDSKTGLKKGYMGIMEPEGKKPILLPGLMFVPGLAFDRNGGRLGYGGGFYDSCISNARAGRIKIETIGLCYNEQIIKEVPMISKDMRVDGVFAESVTDNYEKK